MEFLFSGVLHSSDSKVAIKHMHIKRFKGLMSVMKETRKFRKE